jgi:hypothetical protein
MQHVRFWDIFGKIRRMKLKIEQQFVQTLKTLGHLLKPFYELDLQSTSSVLWHREFCLAGFDCPGQYGSHQRIRS